MTVKIIKNNIYQEENILNIYKQNYRSGPGHARNMGLNFPLESL